MKAPINFIRVGLIASMLTFGLAGCSTSQSSKSNQLQAGMAEVDITPPLGYRMAGYFDERLATAVHDPNKAKVLALRQGDEEFVMIFCDLVGLSLNVTTNARAIISREFGVPVSHIVIAGTHSHTGPLFDDVRRDNLHEEAVAKYGEDPHETIDYPKFLIERLEKVATFAHAKLAPAEVDDGIGKQLGISFNRRYRMKDGTVMTNPGLLNSNIIEPAGPIDPDVGILFVKDRKSKKPLGGLTVFAMHADTAGGTQLSADYPFYVQQTLRKVFGPDYISAFGAGTCGDINHVNTTKMQPYNGFALTERLGTTLGETVAKDIPNLKPIKKPTLAMKSRTLVLPLQTVTPEELAAAQRDILSLNDPHVKLLPKVKTVKALDLAKRGTEWPMEVQVLRLDADTAIVCLPAEIFVELGLGIKQASPFKTTFVVTICNDRPGYLPTLKAFKEGSYEVINSRLEPGTGEKLRDTALELLKELK